MILPVPAAAPTLQEVYGAFLALGVLLLAALPLGLVFTVRAPDLLRTAGARAAARPVVSAVLGAACAVAAFAAAALSAGRPLVGLLALLLLVAVASLTFTGLAAEARALGRALLGRSVDTGDAAPGTLALGWVVIAALPLFPLAGAAVLLWFLARGTGAAAVALVAGRSGE